jgi:hypothetical protein
MPRPLRRFLEQAPEIRPTSLRFADPGLEAAFETTYFHESLP